MKYNVLVIAGTTESRQVIEKLLGENPNERILASVATELGKEMLLEYDIDVHVGRLDQDGFLALLKENPCEKIIDASHPFAKIVSETVKKVAKADVETQVYTEFNEQFQAVAWIILLLLLAEMLILERKNPLFRNIHLFSNKK